MGEFQRVAERIAQGIFKHKEKHEEGVRPDEVPEIIMGATGQRKINCYPGIPGYGCFNEAWFVSLTSQAYKGRKRGHLSCRQAIEKVVQHMQGSCFNKTRVAVLITDNWDVIAYDEWKANFQQIKSAAHIEIYLMSGPSVSEIHL